MTATSCDLESAKLWILPALAVLGCTAFTDVRVGLFEMPGSALPATAILRLAAYRSAAASAYPILRAMAGKRHMTARCDSHHAAAFVLMLSRLATVTAQPCVEMS